ncbi:hypothetical protein [Dactylosporangium sp. NPDC006015]|uniref:hypothetical protein n=1 Tax=Dactylosporangium sp. NPDC006015 TaxID=3154576 RepID=UPI0033B5CD2D
MSTSVGTVGLAGADQLGWVGCRAEEAVRTRAKDRGDPFPDTPWNEIVTGLRMGGHHYVDGSGSVVPVVVGEEFDIVVSLHQRDGYGPPVGVEHYYVDVPDQPLRAS